MTSFFALWLHGIKMMFMRRMAYKWEYIISLLSMFTIEMVAPLFIFVIYYNTPGIQGWTFYEMMLVQGAYLMTKGLAFPLFMGIVWYSNDLMTKGEFDMVLLKPRNVLLMLIASSFDAEDIAKFFGGILITTFALYNIAGWTIIDFMLMLAFIVFGLGMFFCFGLLASAFVIKVIRSWRVYEIMQVLEMIGQYPKTVYPKYLGIIFASILPLLLIAVFPVKAFLGRFDIYMLIAPICVAVLVMICLKIWFSILKSYSSAGG